MTIVFASNDQADFPGSQVVTTAGRFRAAYVSEAFRVSDGDSGGLDYSSWSNFPEVAGTVTWIHFQYWKNTNIEGTNGDGETLFSAYASDGTRIFRWNINNGNINLLINGVTGPNFGDKIGTGIKAIDIMVDTTGSTMVVQLYVEGVLVMNRSETSSEGNPIALNWRAYDHSNSNIFVQETVSEFIVADEDTRGLGLAIMTPTGAGNHSAWIGDHVETGDGDLGTGAVAKSVGLKLSSTMDAYAGPATSAMRALVVKNVASTRGSVGDLRNFVRISSTDYDGSAMGVGETIKSYLSVFDTNPDTTDPWASADFASTEIGTESLA